MNDPIFDIRGAQLYRCQVYRYFSGLSRLYISVYKPHQTDPSFFLLFSDVAYFEGPMGWESVDFRQAAHDDCLALMLKTGIVGEAILQFPDAYAAITDTANLYTVDVPPRTHIRIVAGSATLLTEIPASL